MSITRDIVKDLLPLYVAGEVSADSRAAIDAALADDAELRRFAEALRAGAPAARPAAPPSADRIALDRTKTFLRRRSWVRSLALMFSLMPLAFGFDARGIHYMMLRDAPSSAILFGVTGAAMWVVFVVMNRRGRVTGL